MRSRYSLALVAVALLLPSACRDSNPLGPAPLPTGPMIFTDAFASGVDFQAFSGSKLDALSLDTDIKFRGTASLRIRVPAPGDPSGGYAGGAIVANVPRDLSAYNAVTFYARASQAVTLDVAGLGNDNTGTSLYTAQRDGIALTTAWAKYTIAIPLASRLTSERGLFFFAEGAEGSTAYDIWIDDLMYETLGTVTNPRPTVAPLTASQEIGGTQQLVGTAVTYSVDGVDQTVAAAPAYFTFSSSNPAVATVSATGLVTVLSAGSTNITASLGSTPAVGTIALSATAPPAVAAPTPTRDAANVISLFSDAYTDVPVSTWAAEWSAADVADATIAGNAVKKYTNLVFAGIEFTSPPVNATGMTHFTMDVFVSDASNFRIKLVDFGANGVFDGGDDSEHEVVLSTSSTPALTAGAWSTLSIPLSAFTGMTGRTAIAQLIIVGSSPTTYVDNVYFYAAATGGSGNVVMSFDEATATLSPFEGVTAADLVADPNDAANMVARITNGVQGVAQPWAGVTVSTGGQFSIPQMNVTASLTRMTARVWSPAVGLRIRAKAENAENPAQNHETNATTLTTVANGWETLTFDFSVASPLFDGLPTNPFNADDIYNKLSFFFDYGTKTNTEPRVFYLDDIRFEGTVGSALPLPTPVVAPTTLPAAPTLAAADVISLHTSSGTYTNIPVGNWNPNWGQGGSISDFVIGTGTVKFLNLVNYQGINISPDGLAAGAIDITGRNTLHISYWTADGQSLVISPINADGEYPITVSSITQNGWTSLEIPINQPGFSLTSIRQLKFETTTGLGRFYLDNIYFR
jgi:hypothetical protein